MGVKTRNGRLHTELHTLGVLGEIHMRVFTGRENRLADGVEGVHPLPAADQNRSVWQCVVESQID